MGGYVLVSRLCVSVVGCLGLFLGVLLGLLSASSDDREDGHGLLDHQAGCPGCVVG